jgi:adenylate cyclase
MAGERAQRRLAAILAADVVGYSRLMEKDETGTLVALRQRREGILEPLVAQHQGRIVKLMGDGALVEFASAVDAVQCAIELQKRMAEANSELPDRPAIILRVGVNLGDVVIDGLDIQGDGVNVAARLEAMADPGGICISGSVFEQVERHISVACDDLGDQTLKNISRPVRVYRVGGGTRAVRSNLESPAATKPSIAVLPFANMSGDPHQEFFVDGLTEDIITALSRISALWVIARTSTFTYKGKPTDVKRIAQDLGVRYVMEGSVRRAGDRLRVTAQLIDAATGHHVWAERYDRSLADLFDIQDEITRSVVASTETQVLLAELQAAKSRPSTDLRARDLVTRAWARSYDLTPEAIAEASDLVEEAIRIDPSNPTAHRTRALIFLCRFFVGEILHDAASKAQAFELARTALRLAPRDEYAHLAMAWAWAYAATGGLEDAVAECERGLEINPNCSLILGNLGAYLAALGRPQEAIAACRLSLQLNPRDPSNFWRRYAIAVAHFVAADYAASFEESKRVARSRPHLPSAIVWAAAATALGKADEARTAIDDCLAQRPDLRVSSVAPQFMLRFARDEDHERLLALLRQAGLPD